MTIHSVIPATPRLWTAPAPSARSCVVSLHCSLSSGLQWARLAETLGDEFKVIAPDISGYGHAGPSIDPPATLAHEIELISDRLSEAVGPIHLVGHSYGGAIAFKMATDSPFASRVRSLTLIEPVLPTILLGNELDRPLHDDFAALARTVCDDLWNATPSSAIDRFRTFWAGTEPLPQISPALRQRMIEAADKLVFDFAAILGEKDVLDAAKAIKVPTLLFSGGRSPELTRRIASRLAATIPGAQLEHLPAAGHLMAISHAATLNPKIAAHIRQVEELTGRVANMPETAHALSGP